VALAGEPGIGKTRTAQELASYAETLGTRVLWGWCYEEAGAPPYWPWVQPLRSYIQSTDPEQLRSELGPMAADMAEIVSEVREKLPDLGPLPALEPEQARFRLFESITAFLRNAAHSQPLVLVLDDLHWADKPLCCSSSWPGNWRAVACCRLVSIGLLSCLISTRSRKPWPS
jgi:eukaryotic-like serine/threonine-protein kinase